MKRMVALFLVIVGVLGVLPFGTHAASADDVIWFDDGSRMVIHIDQTSARVANTVSGSKTYTYYDGNGNVNWQAKLSATFAYSGGWYTCSTANCNVTVYENQWYVISNSTIRSSNHAITNLTMGLKHLGVTVQKPQYTIELTCDNNGNIS